MDNCDPTVVNKDITLMVDVDEGVQPLVGAFFSRHENDFLPVAAEPGHVVTTSGQKHVRNACSYS